MKIGALTCGLAACLFTFVAAQEATTTDADGESIVVSVDEDGDTQILSTIDPTDAEDEDEPIGGNGALPAAVGTSPTGTEDAPPTTYRVYYTVGGEQMASWATFIATTPTTGPALDVPSGTVMDAQDFLASISNEAAAVKATHSDSSARRRSGPTLITLGISAASMLFGASLM